MFFWILFRSLHALTAVVATLDFALWSEGITVVRVLGLVVAALGFIFFLHAGIFLGRENLYGGQAGLETRGIYRFTRNPQYAAAIPACLGGGIASCSLPAFIISSCLAGAYALMARAEEPWLERTYGPAYERYKKRVPRFYNWRDMARLAARSDAGQPQPERGIDFPPLERPTGSRGLQTRAIEP